MRIEAGAHLANRYRAEALLGRGGMGEVWRCHDLEQRRDVAVKAVRPELLRDAWAGRLFHGEVAAVARLNHPGIVPVYDLVTEPDGSAYLVMAYRPGSTLSVSVTQAPGWAFVRDVLIQVLSALAYAHARGVLHLDIKPDNVLVDGDQGGVRATLVDFGISRIRRPGRGVEQWFGRGALVGTVGYLAPERCAGVLERFGPWTDLYSIGVMAYELCAGERPFPDQAAIPSLLRRMTERAPRLVPRSVAVPSGFVELCEQLLATEPRDRPLRAADVLVALRELEGVVDGPPSVESSELAESVAPAPGPSSGSLIPLRALRAASIVPTLEPVAASAQTSVLVPAPRTTGSTRTVTGDAAAAFTAEVAPPPAGAYGLFGLRDLPVLGRVDERGALWASVADTVTQKRPHLVLLEGPAGAGKSRLARDAMERAEELGFCIGVQTSWSAERSGDEGLRGLVENLLDCRGAPLEGVRARLAVWLERIPGDHRAMTRDAELLLRPPPDAAPDAGLPLRVAVEVVVRTAAIRPVLLWLDDVHFARGEALALVDALCKRGELAVCIVATARDDELTDAAAHRALLEHCESSTVRVERLTLPATRQLVRGLLNVDDELCDLLSERAEGNPLFASELLRQLVTDDALRRLDGRYRLMRPASLETIPADIGVVWDRRLAQSGAGRRDLAALALVRDRVSLEVAGHLAEVIGPSLETSLSRALVAGLCQVQGGAYVWVHGLLRESLVKGLEPTDAQVLHDAAAAALAPLVGREDVQEERARHLSRAAGRAREACEAMLEAGLWSFRHAEIEPRRSRFEALVEWAQAAGLADLEARALAELAYLEAETGNAERAAERIAEAREALAGGGYQAAAAWVAMRHSQAGRLGGRVEEGVQATEEALGLARAAGESEVVAMALRQQGVDRYRSHHLTEAKPLFDEAALLCRTRADRVGEAIALRSLAFFETGSQAVVIAARAVDLAREAGAPRVELICKQVWVDMLARSGDMARARCEAQALAEEAARRSLRQTVSLLELQCAAWAAADAEWGAAREHKERATAWGAATGASAERVILGALELVLALAAGDELGAVEAAASLEQSRGGYDDDTLRALLEQARSLSGGSVGTTYAEQDELEESQMK